MWNDVVDNNVNLSVCAPEVGMLQPEALSQANSLTVSPLFLSTGNHVNSMHRCTWRNYFSNLYFESCGAAVCAQRLFVRMHGVEIFNIIYFSVTLLLLCLSISMDVVQKQLRGG